MKVTPVSISVTTPADFAASTAASEVNGVSVPETMTVDARWRVEVPPRKDVPETVSDVQEEDPTLAVGAFPRQTTRKTCHKTPKPPWVPGVTAIVWSWKHGVGLVPGTIPRCSHASDCGLVGNPLSRAWGASS